jgi:hypothetical protein
MHRFETANSAEISAISEYQQAPLPGLTVQPMSDTMRHWLGVVCKEERKKRHDVLQVDIATQTRNNQSTIARFERGEGWPNFPDLVVAAYARECELEPIELWAEALDRWKAEGGVQATVTDLRERIAEKRASRAPQHEAVEADLAGELGPDSQPSQPKRRTGTRDQSRGA